MPTERSEHQAWAESQIAALIELGINPLDAQKSVDWVLEHLPPDADPATHIFDAAELYEEPDTPENVHDSRADWYAADHIPPKYKRLLDAQEESE